LGNGGEGGGWGGGVAPLQGSGKGKKSKKNEKFEATRGGGVDIGQEKIKPEKSVVHST